jgi:hypothetical protein
MVAENDVERHLKKAVYDWLIVPFASYLGGEWAAAFEASGAEPPSSLHEADMHATQRQAESDMRDRRIALLERLNAWGGGFPAEEITPPVSAEDDFENGMGFLFGTRPDPS